MIRSLALILLALPAKAEVIATLQARSGSLPPPAAWSWSAEFHADGTVETTWCKGYAETAPGCASRNDAFDLEALQTALAPWAGAAPVTPDPAPPIGGGSRSGSIGALVLPPHPLPADVARTDQALDLLFGFLPEGALDDTSARAKAP